MKSPFVHAALGCCVLCTASVLTTLAASPAAAQSTWFGARQTDAVADPRAAACVSLALGKPDPANGFDQNALTAVAATFDITPVLDALATCRIALRAFPAEPKVIVGHYNAAFTLAVLLFGFNDFPQTDEDAVQKARAIAAGDQTIVAKRMAYFFLGSACEYGVGTAPDLQEAATWYGLGADAGDTIAARELARLKEQQ
jgi:TPR repeat protein